LLVCRPEREHGHQSSAANNQPAAQKNKSLARDYLAALGTDLNEPAKPAHAIVMQLLGKLRRGIKFVVPPSGGLE